jgi:hypothetical protein
VIQTGVREGKRTLYTALAEYGLVLAMAGIIVVNSWTIQAGDSVFSRLATVWSLSQHGVFHLETEEGAEENPFAEFSVDKVRINGRTLSSKPPLLAVIMTAEYLILKPLTGWRLENRDDLRNILRVMTLTLVILPLAAAALIFVRILRRLPLSSMQRLVMLAGLTLGCQLPAFAAQFNNHVPAAAALIAAVYCAIRLLPPPGLTMPGGTPAPRPALFAGFGFFSALVFTLDMPATIFPAFMGLALFLRYPRQTLTWGLAGAVPPMLLHVAAMIHATGGLLPVQMNRDCYLYESSFWRNPMGIDALHEPDSTYLFHMTFGRKGVFLLFPVLLLALPAFVEALFNRQTPARRWVIGGGLAWIIMTFYYVTGTNNYGGMAYGFRWYIAAMPVLLLMGAVFARRIRGAGWLAVAVLAAVSFFSARECLAAPWGENAEWTCRWIFGPPW